MTQLAATIASVTNGSGVSPIVRADDWMQVTLYTEATGVVLVMAGGQVRLPVGLVITILLAPGNTIGGRIDSASASAEVGTVNCIAQPVPWSTSMLARLGEERRELARDTGSNGRGNARGNF